MTIYCNRCQLGIKSLMIEEDARVRDCYAQLERHVHANHRDTMPQFQQVMGKAGMLITSYLLIHAYALIPETETKFLGTHNKVIEEILKVLGIEVTETLETEKEVIEEKING